MIYHFVNLVSWKKICYLMLCERRLNVKSIYYCDSVSLYFLARIFGYNFLLYPGVLAYSNLTNGMDTIALVASKNNIQENQYVLPFFNNLDDINVFNFHNIDFSLYKNVFIGISTPKQNYLAIRLSLLYPELNIWCFGAALQSKPKFHLLGFTWFFMFIENPSRTFKKIYSTFYSIILLLKKRNRLKFSIFLSFILRR